jgi:hypothetical protein
MLGRCHAEAAFEFRNLLAVGHARDASAVVLSMTARNVAKPRWPSNPK